MTMKLITAGLIAALSVTAGAALAQGHRDRPDLAAMDADGDGAVSLEEMTAYAQARSAERVARMFARLDADENGMIDADEFAAAKERRGNRPGGPGRPAGD
ncbi:MAG: EF-hand domain-containing protein [Loktanella sp.]|nr:EF-hand domain-containing protein [Loktanella sp.]